MILSNNRKNPYIIGRPIYEKELFFGRDNLFNFVNANLNNGAKVILLQGQRRIGKSSVLNQIPNFVGGDKFAFVYFDLQDKARLTLAEVLEKLATEIIIKLKLKKDNIKPPLKTDLEANAEIFSEFFLPQLFQNLGSKNLVLLLDEFDVLSDYNPASAIQHFFPYLQYIISNHQQLFIIPVVGRRLDDMKNLLNLFRRAPNQEIGLLDEKSATQLITKPAEGVLEYQPDAIAAILELSAGHPYFTQVICFQIFQQAEAEDKWQVKRADVNNIVDRAIESAEGGLTWFRDGLPIPERVILSAVAEAQRIAAMKPTQVVTELLKKYGVVPTKSLLEAADRLVEWGFLVKSSKFWERVPKYKVKIELVRRWLLKRYSLKSEILELENLSSNVIDTYEQRLRMNPNDFPALFWIAKESLQAKDFSKAVKLYERGHKINPLQAEDGLLESLLGYAQELMEQKKWEVAKEKFEEVLNLDRDNKLAQDKLREIKQFTKIKRNYFTVDIFTGVLAVPLLIGIGIGVGLQVRENKLIRERFSSGDKILFENANNKNYNDQFSRCNQEFQEKNYDEAANCFEEFAENYRNEPEPLIYYNNSLASYGNPLTIAVVVPADKNQIRAKSILQGVAQAQNEYNETQLKNNSSSPNTNIRLLKIVIANDSNDDQISAKVAQEIAKNKDILGVIGHYDSSVSKAALEVYKKENLAMVSSISTSTELEGDVFFRTNINNSVFSKKLAEYLQDLGIEKVMVFYNEQNSFSRNIKEHFEYYFTSLNPDNQIEFEDSSEESFDAKEAVENVVNNGFQAAMLFQDIRTIDQAIEIAKANYQLPENQRLRLFDPSTLYDCATLNQGKQAVKGLILAVPWHKELYTAQAFLKRVKAQWGGVVDWRAATSYDATKAFIDALSNSGDNPIRTTILKKLKEVNLPPEETSGQNLRFDPDGEIIREVILVEVVESLNPACSNLDFRLVEE